MAKRLLIDGETVKRFPNSVKLTICDHPDYEPFLVCTPQDDSPVDVLKLHAPLSAGDINWFGFDIIGETTRRKSKKNDLLVVSKDRANKYDYERFAKIILHYDVDPFDIIKECCGIIKSKEE